MKKKTLSLLMCLSIAMTFLVGCQSHTKPDISQMSEASTITSETISEESVPQTTLLTIENMGNTLTFSEVPERVIVLSYDTAEIMSALDLESKIIGLAPADSDLTDVLPAYRDKVATIPLMENLSNGVPNLETVLAMKPDFVYGASYSFMNTNAGDASDYLSMGINVYGSTGTYSDNPTLDDTFQDIINIGKIFHVEEKATDLVSELQARVDKITSSIDNSSKVSVFVYDSEEDAPYTAGGTSLESKLIDLAGGKNIYSDLDADFATVAWEDVIVSNPDVILINKYGSDEDVAQKIAFLKSQPELANITAIKENRFIAVSMLAIFPSLQNIDVIEVIADGIQNENYIVSAD